MKRLNYSDPFILGSVSPENVDMLSIDDCRCSSSRILKAGYTFPFILTMNELFTSGKDSYFVVSILPPSEHVDSGLVLNCTMSITCIYHVWHIFKSRVRFY